MFLNMTADEICAAIRAARLRSEDVVCATIRRRRELAQKLGLWR